MRHPEGRDHGLPAAVDTCHLDVLDRESIRSAVARTLERHGRIDVLVNNAGYGLRGVFETSTQDQIQRQFATNVFGLMDVTREVLPAMRAQKGGTIINVSSIGGRLGAPLYSLYAASKFAVEGFSESLQYELRPCNIRVRLVEPGFIRTEFHGGSLDKSACDIEAYQGIEAAVAIKDEAAASKGAAPAVIARTIFRAATDRGWRLRYAAGYNAGPVLVARRLLPDALFFRLIRAFTT